MERRDQIACPRAARYAAGPAMNVQLFSTKKCAESRKAERFFKERGVKLHVVDLGHCRQRQSRSRARLRCCCLH